MSKAKQEAAVVPAEETTIAKRTAAVVAAEINHIKGQTARMLIYNSIEIGRKLVEAKHYVAHGEWGQWLKDQVDFSQSTANNHMRIFERYGSDQLSLLGDNAKSEAFGDLSYSQAVALLAIPDEEVEAFVQDNNVPDMSTRELQAAIKAKDEAEQLQKEAEEREKAAIEREQAAKSARELVSKKLEEAQIEARNAETERERLESELAAAQSANDEKGTAKVKAELKKAEKTVSEYQRQINELENGIIEAVKQREKELEEQAADKLKKRENELAEQARKNQMELNQQIEKLNQQLQRSNNESFLKAKLQIETIIQNGDALLKAIAAVIDPEEQGKLKAAAAKVVDQLRSTL